MSASQKCIMLFGIITVFEGTSRWKPKIHVDTNYENRILSFVPSHTESPDRVVSTPAAYFRGPAIDC
jgi:hypothetical protein